MSSKEETKNHSSQVRNRSKDGHKREGHFKRMNERSTQYIRGSVTDDHISKINL